MNNGLPDLVQFIKMMSPDISRRATAPYEKKMLEDLFDIKFQKYPKIQGILLTEENEQ